jgi:magnesium-protoporphyrin IX monomethyl ester (oxidative) cyclase
MDRIDVSPRFYTTDSRAEWDAMMAEYEGDNNHDHFQRTPSLRTKWRSAFRRCSPELRQEFLDFLISS